MTDTAPYHRVTIEGINVSSDVVTVSVEDHDQLIDKATIVMSDPTETTGEVPREGHRVLVDLGWSSEHAVLFEGVVYNVRVDARGTARHWVTITVLDLSYRLKRRPTQATHHVGALSSIITQLVTGDPSLGISVGQIEPDPDPEFTQQSPLRQTHQSDWDFIQDLAGRYGCRAFVEYNDNASRFYFVPLARLLQSDPLGRLSYSGNTGRLISIRYERMASAAAPIASATTSDPASGSATSAVGSAPSPEPEAIPGSAAHARAPGGGTRLDCALQVTALATGRPEDQRPQSTIRGLPSDPALVQRAVFQDPTNVLGLRAIGECVGTVQLRAKGKVALDGVAAWATGDWYVRQVNHVVGAPSSGRPMYRNRFLLTR